MEETQEEKVACVAFYRSMNSCWRHPIGSAERNICAENVIGMTDITEEKERCEATLGSARQTCVAELKEKVELLVLFHLYELEARAEELLGLGLVTKEAVVELEVFIETKKTEVERAGSPSTWKTIIKEAKFKWGEFNNKLSFRN